ncbi:MAG: DUF481 domain-containing protein [Polyangiales bacterium]
MSDPASSPDPADAPSADPASAPDAGALQSPDAPLDADASDSVDDPAREAEPPASPLAEPELLEADHTEENVTGVDAVTLHDARVKQERPEDDTVHAQLSAGMVLNSGNTRSFQANGGGSLEVVRRLNVFSMELAFAYGLADLEPSDDDDDYDKNVANLNANARYDRFFGAMDAAFVGTALRRDTFAGLDARLQGRVGYLRNLCKKSGRRLWAEGGYDLTYDNFFPDPLVDDAGVPLLDLDGTPVDQTQIIHAARFFVGHRNRLNDAVLLRVGLEALFNLQQGQDIRFNASAALASRLMRQLSLELQFLSLFDNVPVPGTEKLDTLTRVQFVYQLL